METLRDGIKTYIYAWNFSTIAKKHIFQEGNLVR